ncbi:MAG: type II toxin-antitoxin system RelE/ParE family toxin [Bacteroidota bacterium]
MNVTFSNQFQKQIKKLKNKELASHVEQAILSVMDAPSISYIRNIKKLKGHTNAYRIKLGDYRLGLYIFDDLVEFICFLHRKDVYKYFP